MKNVEATAKVGMVVAVPAATLRWRKGGPDEFTYVSTDGRFTINRDEGITLCENPHPMGKGKPACGGGEEHYYPLWQLFDNRNQKVDAGPTLREMKASAEHEARRA